MPEQIIAITSILGMDTGKPIVQLTTPKGEVIQISSRDARAIALNLLSAAEASEQDLCVFRFVTESLKAPVDAAAQIISELRGLRDELGETVPGSIPIED